MGPLVGLLVACLCFQGAGVVKSEEVQFSHGHQRRAADVAEQTGEVALKAFVKIYAFPESGDTKEAQWFCNGAIVADSWVLTTSACVWSYQSGHMNQTVGQGVAILIIAGITDADTWHGPHVQVRAANSFEIDGVASSDEKLGLIRTAAPFTFGEHVQAAEYYTGTETTLNQPYSVLSGCTMPQARGQPGLDACGPEGDMRRSVPEAVPVSQVSEVDATTVIQSLLPNWPATGSSFFMYTENKACYGDVGSPMFAKRDDNGRVVLVGLALTGLGSGAQTPGWVTPAIDAPFLGCNDSASIDIYTGIHPARDWIADTISREFICSEMQKLVLSNPLRNSVGAGLSLCLRHGSAWGNELWIRTPAGVGWQGNSAPMSLTTSRGLAMQPDSFEATVEDSRALLMLKFNQPIMWDRELLYLEIPRFENTKNCGGQGWSIEVRNCSMVSVLGSDSVALRTCSESARFAYPPSFLNGPVYCDRCNACKEVGPGAFSCTHEGLEFTRGEHVFRGC